MLAQVIRRLLLSKTEIMPFTSVNWRIRLPSRTRRWYSLHHVKAWITYDVGSSHPGAGEGPKGLAVRQLKRYASWVQNVVRQFGLLSVVGVEYWEIQSLVREDRDWRTSGVPVVAMHRWVAKFGLDKRWKHLSAKLFSRLIFTIRPLVDDEVDRH